MKCADNLKHIPFIDDMNILCLIIFLHIIVGYWHQRADKRHGIGNPPSR